MEMKNKQACFSQAQNRGFTLIEILVVVGILGIIAVVASNVFFTTLRSSGKTKVLTTVKQNGDYALSVMERMIRDSQEVMTNSDGQYCVAGMKKIKVKKLDGTELEFVCPEEEEAGTTNSRIASNSAHLTSSEVKVDSCSFDCESKGQFYPKTVTINFTLSQSAVTSRPEEQASVNFTTTVSVRNF